jgi:hypothetical protein
MHSEIRPAALIRYRKTVAPDPELASADNGKANTARSDNDDTAISRAVRSDACNRRVMCINDRAEGMLARNKLLEHPFAPNPGQPDGSMYEAQCVRTKAGFMDCGTAGLFNFGKRAVDPNAQCRRTGNSAPKQASLRVFNARAAARAAAVNPGE